MAHVLVTGASGFTGRYVVDELTRSGHQVTQLDSAVKSRDENESSQTKASGRSIAADLTDLASLTRAMDACCPEIIIHLAGIAFVGHDNPNSFYDVNLIGTRNLLQALHDAKISPQRVVLASSANVYGNTAGDTINEDCPVRPQNDYAASKAAMEMLARIWENSFPVVIARPFNYTGIGQTENFLVPKIVAHFAKKAPQIRLGNIDVWRDYSDVRWMALAYKALMLEGVPGQTYNLGSGESVSIHQIIERLQAISGHKIEVISDPALMRKNELYRVCADTSKIKSIESIPPAIAFEDTLGWMYEDALGRRV